MKDYLVIKLMRPAFTNSSIDEVNKKKFIKALKTLNELAKNSGKEFLFSLSKGLEWTNYDIIVDVYSNDQLSDDIKQTIVEQIKIFAHDREYMREKTPQYQEPFTVFFHKLDAYDVIEVDNDK